MNLGESWQALSDCIAPEAQSFATAREQDGDAWYALFGDRPRSLLLPANHRKARNTALRFFLPEVWRELYGRARLCLNDLFTTHARLPRLTLPPASTMELCNELAITDSPQLAFLIGTPGPYQKASILVMSSQGDACALVKVALRARANVMVGAETTWLRTLNCCPTLDGAVPGLLRAGSARNGCRYLVQSLLRGRPGTRAFTSLHADFLQRLGAVDCYTETFTRSPIHRSLHHDFAKLEAALPERWRSLFRTALAECAHSLQSWQGPFVISHGDFATWNIRTQNDSIRVFDWEYASAGASPLFDLFHFHLIGPASSGRDLGVRDMRHALSPARAYALLTYPDFDWSPAVVAAHGLAYLLRTLLFYGLSRGELLESHFVVRAYCNLIENRNSWLPSPP